MRGFQKYLSTEIGIEYKSCLYFFAMLFFYCMYRLLGGIYEASILHMTEMILAIYAMAYMQVYLLRNFDECECFGLFELVASLGCAAIYTVMSWGFNWFDRKVGVTIGFACYVLFLYVCMFLANKVKREIDTKMLNEELEEFKKRRGEE